LLCLTLCLALVGIHRTTFAKHASEVKDLSEKTVEVGISSQKTHEAWVDEEHRLLEKIEDLERLLDHTKWQRKKLTVYRQDLNEKIAELGRKAEAMQAVNMKLLPVLEENLDRLKTTIGTDIPSHLSERRKSLLHAETVFNDYDMSLLDKTRAVLDATAREVDFGHRVNVSEDEIEISGQNRRVKMLQVGRAGLYAMTLDSEKAYRWDPGSSRWMAIEHEITSINEAIEIAEGIRLVGLSRLPVTQPAGVQTQEAESK
jgi:hypothetical protein